VTISTREGEGRRAKGADKKPTAFCVLGSAF
jgi:hypothetical protein